MSRRHYSSSAAATTLSSSVTAAQTTITVGSTAGLPVQYPFTLILDEGTTTEEVVEVTAGSGSTLTVTRGVDGTTAIGHAAGGAVQHGVSARDFDEPNAHIAATTGVHGVSGSVVGTSDTQTLTGKTIDGGSNTLSNIPASAMKAEAWTTFTPAWTSSGTAPALVDGTLTGKYRKTGKTVQFVVRLVAGSGTTFGSGSWSFSLPPSLPTGTTLPAGQVHGTAYHAATGLVYMLGADLGVNATSTMVSAHAAGLVSATIPVAWASGDTLQIAGTYETA